MRIIIHISIVLCSLMLIGCGGDISDSDIAKKARGDLKDESTSSEDLKENYSGVTRQELFDATREYFSRGTMKEVEKLEPSTCSESDFGKGETLTEYFAPIKIGSDYFLSLSCFHKKYKTLFNSDGNLQYRTIIWEGHLGLADDPCDDLEAISFYDENLLGVPGLHGIVYTMFNQYELIAMELDILDSENCDAKTMGQCLARLIKEQCPDNKFVQTGGLEDDGSLHYDTIGFHYESPTGFFPKGLEHHRDELMEYRNTLYERFHDNGPYSVNNNYSEKDKQDYHFEQKDLILDEAIELKFNEDREPFEYGVSSDYNVYWGLTGDYFNDPN
ncbi:MAG: hypothetical protein IJI23_06750 [Lachnospiraceae bacterium]|nr:hypothetical protein [Lachnospiraceae bacterium]